MASRFHPGQFDGQNSSNYLRGSNTSESQFPRMFGGVAAATSDSPRPSSVSSTHSYQSSSSLGGGSAGGSAGGSHDYDICVGEEVKIAIGVALERFRLSEEQKDLEFPSSLTSKERAYIHRQCDKMGLKHKSAGKGANRFLVVSKKDGLFQSQSVAVFTMARNTRHQIHSLLHSYPLTSKERQDLMPRTDRGMHADGIGRELSKTATGRLNNGVPQIPPARQPAPELEAFRKTLPVYKMTAPILKAIQEHKVVLVAGETGSGKTTQVPQMILDECCSKNKPCRIFCTQPRRLSALSVSERVAAERGEKIGQAVGYQIRLESRVSPKTLLTFCTNGVLLRTLMGGDAALSTLTHVIVDEIHERDRFCDFLLIALREVQYKYKNLKIILMSAALNTQLFCNYFKGCPIISVPGKLFDVEEYFLEDVLRITNYSNPKMQRHKKDLDKVERQALELEELILHDIGNLDLADEGLGGEGDEASTPPPTTHRDLITSHAELGQEKDELSEDIIGEMDRLLSEAWLTGNEDNFTQVFHLISAENVSVDYLHSATGVTPLMISSARGFFTVVEQLLNLGASVMLRASNNWTALDWARKFDRHDVIELLHAYQVATDNAQHDDTVLVKQSTAAMTEQDKNLLNLYHHTFDDDRVDLQLILSLLHNIHSGQREGAVLVFLPGYDDIVSLRDMIMEDKSFSELSRYLIYTLHSSMQSTDQKKVFRPPPQGVRKIILSTNIAESSITIDDVVFVIDSGKVKEKSFDALTSVSMLKVHWVSKASATQRKGRAGRCQPGVCYHLFSKVRYEGLQDYPDPELLRYPLQELCLHTKLLAPSNTSIADFLSKAPEPPAFLITRNAVHILKQIDALDPFEDMTELGHHLADLPVEPKYGKMVLYAVVLKCLDPVLTIACALAYKDPFLLPSEPYRRREAAMVRRRFSAGTYSDHMVLLRAFQGWQKAKMEGWERQFCDKNFVSASTMEMIVGMRTQLLGQLRASGFVKTRGGGDIRDLNTNSENWAVVKAALCAGMYPNVIRVNRARMILSTMKESKVRFHAHSVLSPAPSSVSSNHTTAVKSLPTDWLVFEEMTRPRRLALVQCSTVVSPITMFLFGGPAKMNPDTIQEVENCHTLSAEANGQGQGQGRRHLPSSSGDSGMMYPSSTTSHEEDSNSDSDPEDKPQAASTNGGGPNGDNRAGSGPPGTSKDVNVALDDWISFRVDTEAAYLGLQLRQKWHALFIRRMRAPTKPWSQVDEQTIRKVITVLTNEEQSIGLQQPAGIGQRPRPMSAELSVSSGGSRRGSCDTEQSDDSSSNGTFPDPSKTPTRGRPFKVFQNSPKKKEFGRFLRSTPSEEKSETSNSGSNSLRGSNTSSPSHSPPQPASPASDLSTGGEGSSCYYIIKANSHKQLDLSYQRGVWPVSTVNERKIAKNIKEGRPVFLVFSVQGSGHFQGYAQILEQTGTERNREFGCPHHGAAFSVEWIKKANLPFQQSHHLLNPWNENKRVQVSRDGQEVEPTVGEKLVHLWDALPNFPARSPKYPSQAGAFQGQGGHPYQGQGYGGFGDEDPLSGYGGGGGVPQPQQHRGGYGGFMGGGGGYGQPPMHPHHMGMGGPGQQQFPGGGGPGGVFMGGPAGYGHHPPPHPHAQNPVMILQRGQGHHPQVKPGGGGGGYMGGQK